MTSGWRAGDDVAHGLGIADIDRLERGAVRERPLEVPALARAEVVDDGHLVPARDERVDEVRADEAGAAGYECLHGRRMVDGSARLSRWPRVSADDSQIDELIAGGENSRVEFKSSLRYDLEAGEKNLTLQKVVAKTVAGFMNADRRQPLDRSE